MCVYVIYTYEPEPWLATAALIALVHMLGMFAVKLHVASKQFSLSYPASVNNAELQSCPAEA